MTLAVCMQCGASKSGSLAPCDKCGFEPATTTDGAYSMALSDHYFPAAQLRQLGAQIAAGTRPRFDPSLLSELAKALSNLKQPKQQETTEQRGLDATGLKATVNAACINHETIDVVSADQSSMSFSEAAFAGLLVAAKSWGWLGGDDFVYIDGGRILNRPIADGMRLSANESRELASIVASRCADSPSNPEFQQLLDVLREGAVTIRIT